MRKYLSLVILVCILAAIFSLAPQVNADGAGLILSESQGYAGDEVYLRGVNITEYANDCVYIRYETDFGKFITVQEVCLNSGGNFTSDEFRVPASYKGRHYIGIALNETATPSYKVPFMVKPKVELAGQNSGYVGDTVIVRGSGFARNETVSVWYFVDSSTHVAFNASPADADGNWEATFMVPASPKGEHRITSDSQNTPYTSVQNTVFTVVPKIILDKSSGTAGDTVIITGTGFGKNEPNIQILFDGVTLDITPIQSGADGCWQSSLMVPACVGGQHSVDAKGYLTSPTAVADVPFTVGAAIHIEPGTGNVGTSITVSGSGFPASSSVTITYDGATRGTAQTDGDGAFHGVTFSATHTQASHQAVHEIVATSGATTARGQFVMESMAPPVPHPVSPADGERIGFLGDQTPTMTWQPVADASGVTYSLRLARDAEFTDIILSISGLSETSYSVSESHALPAGTYYWQVKAVDGAQNDSGWSGVCHFKCDFLPLSMFILIIVVLVASAGLAVYFLVLRRE